MTQVGFISYSHADEAMKDELLAHFVMLKRSGLIDIWHDRKLLPGTEVEHEIDERLEKADVVLLLVSTAFLNSMWCYEREMQRALERQARGEARVLPVILKPSEWQESQLGKLVAVPRDGKPISLHPDRDAAYLEVTTEIRRAILEPSAATSPVPLRPRDMSRGEGSRRHAIQAQRLRIPKSFTDLDKDEYLHASFEGVSAFFENSLRAVENDDPRLQGRFRRIDANRFSASIYRDGKALARCTVFLGGFMNGIAYVSGETTSTSSYNELLSVEVIDDRLGLRSMMQRDADLDVEAAANLLWSLVVQPMMYR